VLSPQNIGTYEKGCKMPYIFIILRVIILRVQFLIKSLIVRCVLVIVVLQFYDPEEFWALMKKRGIRL